MVKPLVLAALCCLVGLQPAVARSGHHRHDYRHHRHFGRGHEGGMPITAQSDSIRINSVGEVISKPTAVIEKERNFNNRARNTLSGRPVPDAPGNTPAQR